MKTRFVIFVCAAVMMAACCGRNSQSSSSCSHKSEEKTCSHSAEKASCKATCAAEKPSCKATEKACCKSAGDVKKIISAQVWIKPEKVDAFVAAAKDVIEKSRAEAGCISYSLYQDPQDKTVFLFFEEWKNQEAVDFHFATEHFQKFGEVLNDCASTPAVITVFDSTAEKKL